MEHLDVIREIRRKLAIDGPQRVRAPGDFAKVTLPERDCDAIRDLLIAERPGIVIEIGLAPGRLRALRLPDPPVEPGFKELTPFWPGAC